MLLPGMLSILCHFNIVREKKCKFYNLKAISVPGRKLIFGKTAYLSLGLFFSNLLIFAGTFFGGSILGTTIPVSAGMMGALFTTSVLFAAAFCVGSGKISLGIGFFLAVPFLIWGGSIPLYVLHLYLAFRFSKGVTIGLGIVESLVSGLALGADDYICKPFGVSELRARIAAHLRRERREHSIRISFENASFNLSAKQLAVRNHIVPLTKGEYEICEFLAKNRNQVFTKEQIFEQVFGYDSDSNDNTIATHIKNIRTKLQEFQYMPIKTVWGWVINGKFEEKGDNSIEFVLPQIFCLYLRIRSDIGCDTTLGIQFAHGRECCISGKSGGETGSISL